MTALPSGKLAIKVDHRESACGVAAVLAQLPGVTIRLCQLVVGDYSFRDELVFERKTMRDLAVSLVDGRLFRQAQRLSAQAAHPVLILEGKSRDLAGIAVRRESIQGALVTLSLIFGIPILRALDPEESARLIVYAARQFERLGCVESAHPRQPARPRGKERIQSYILQGLPGVGPKRARALLAGLGTVRQVMQASSDELQRIEGIGPQTAERILWVLT